MIFFLFLGEVERLLRDYPQNQELVRNLGSRYYQVVYPTQVRQRDKFGVSTREVDKIFTKVVHNHVKKRIFLKYTLHFFYQFGGLGRAANDHSSPQNRVVSLLLKTNLCFKSLFCSILVHYTNHVMKL